MLHRQHNGELKQGAWKTRLRRPWVMQMIVHGFPSRLAALQFEWAWQHPDLSRHLRDPLGQPLFQHRRPKHLEMNVHIVRKMLSCHPYRTWPLHIKLFTKEAAAAWSEATRNIDQDPLPSGFTSSIELEGVDGKSGIIGSGRREPIHIKDEKFTSAYLAKNTALLASNPILKCSICQEHLATYTTDALSTALCPAPSCISTSHLSCLSKKFLDADPSATTLVPRGGICGSCDIYILWGDIIRGCYRRLAGGVLEEDDVPEVDEGELYDSDTDERVVLVPTTRKTILKGTTVAPTPKQMKPRQIKSHVVSSSEGELFDFDVSSSSDLSDKSRKRGRPPKSLFNDPSLQHTVAGKSRVRGTTKRKNPLQRPPAPQEKEHKVDMPKQPKKRGQPRKASPTTPAIHVNAAPLIVSPPKKRKVTLKKKISSASSEGKLFDSDATSANGSPIRRPQKAFSSPTGAPPSLTPSLLTRDGNAINPATTRRTPGRPRKNPVSSPNPPKAITAKSVPGKRGTKQYSTAIGTAVSDSSGEFFDFDALSNASSEDEAPPALVPPRYQKVGVASVRARYGTEKEGGNLSMVPQQGIPIASTEFYNDQERTSLLRVLSSMSITSPSSSPVPHYIEISD